MFKKRGKWYITFRSVPDGRSVQRVSGANKTLAKAHEARMRLEWQQFKATGVYRDPKMDLPIQDHIVAYLAHAESTVSDQRYNLIATRLRRSYVCTYRGDAGRILKSLQDRFAPSTVDGYIQVLKAFGQWMVDNDRADKNPFRTMRRTFRKGDETFVRRALTLAEVRRLAEASPGRAVLYYVAATTGLRAGELKSLTWDSVQLVGKTKVWALVLSGENTKNGKAATIPLQPWVAEMMIPRLPGIPLFEAEDVSASSIREDAAVAGISLTDAEGRRLDFHSLRASAATILLGLGVQADAVQEIMRHGSFQTTIQHYRKNDIDLLSQQIVIPDPRQEAI